MTMIDNREGFGAAIVNADTNYRNSYIELNDNKIYGETPIQDCPGDGSFCKMFNKYGIMIHGGTI
jgi:hypothetical protein